MVELKLMALESDFLEMVIRLDSVNALNVAESPMLEQMALLMVLHYVYLKATHLESAKLSA